MRTALSPDTARALDDLEATFPGRVTTVDQDGTGTILRIDEVQLSERWSPRMGQLWFVVPFHYPDSAIYPYYVTEAQPVGGLVPALQVVPWRGMNATQVSLRHTSWDPRRDTAVGSVLQTMAWLRST